MRVLLVSWEYPPVVVGGLGRHVHHLAEELAAAGQEVTVLTRRPPGTDAVTHPTADEVVNGVRVVAVAEDPLEFDFGTDMMAWTQAFNHSLVRAGLTLLREWTPDLVHAHDWLVAHAAIALSEFADVPLVTTFHATEAGRHSGWVAGPVNRQVHSVEWWLARESDEIITCSASMQAEVDALFGPGLPQISVIPNGIDTDGWPFAPRLHRDGPSELLFAGRLEYEKGVQDLLAALPRIRRSHPGTVLTVAGVGTQADRLAELARRHRVARSVRFVGALDRDELVAAMHRADAVVLPSRYEPFGIIALEAAATGIPLIVSRVGGLAEAVRDGETGLTFAPADVAGLATAVRRTLDDPAAAAQRAEAAADGLSEFTWPEVARRTVEIYRGAKRAPRQPLARPVIVTRPLPDRDPNNP